MDPVDQSHFMNTAKTLPLFSDTMSGGNIQRLVTADGTYATQSAFSTVTVSKKEDR